MSYGNAIGAGDRVGDLLRRRPVRPDVLERLVLCPVEVRVRRRGIPRSRAHAAWLLRFADDHLRLSLDPGGGLGGLADLRSFRYVPGRNEVRSPGL